MNLYESTVIALVHTLARRPYIVTEHRFVLRQCSAMPDFLGIAIKLLTIFFAIYIVASNFALFHRLGFAERVRILEGFQNSRISVCRDFVRFYQTLAIFSVASEKEWGV
ncbi:hypothetical protein LMORI2_02660 [Limnohabitans sp. MORI2]|nr:hypothetical protein LMORI2_02660 [Limnohabitans sp. MORI2]